MILCYLFAQWGKLPAPRLWVFPSSVAPMVGILSVELHRKCDRWWGHCPSSKQSKQNAYIQLRTPGKDPEGTPVSKDPDGTPVSQDSDGTPYPMALMVLPYRRTKMLQPSRRNNRAEVEDSESSGQGGGHCRTKLEDQRVFSMTVDHDTGVVRVELGLTSNFPSFG